MGFLRLFLAMSVALSHAYPFFGFVLPHQEPTVITFFVISGFYMSLILSQKYTGKNNSYRLFITNRILRIYPTYLVVLAAIFLLSLAKFMFHLGDADNAIVRFLEFTAGLPVPQTILILANLVLRNVTLVFTTDYFLNLSKDPGYFLILPAWSLQIEMLFYLVVPFVPKKSLRALVIFSAVFITLNQFVFLPNAADLPLIHTFLSYVFYFLLGVFSFEFYKKLEHVRIPKIAEQIIFFIMCVSLFIFLINPFSLEISPSARVLFYVFFALLVPFAFSLTRDSSIDKFLGSLSYPVFVSHILIFKLLSNSFFIENKMLFNILFLTITLIVSFFLVRFLEEPINNFRQKRLRGKIRS